MNKRPFYLFKRRLPSGKRVWYYYFYTENKERSTPRSTGCQRKNDAVIFCSSLFKQGTLGDSNMLFRTFAEGWFQKGHPEYEEAVRSGRVKPTTMRNYRACLKWNLLPYFAKIPIGEITMGSIISFRETLVKKGLSAGKINTVIGTLRKMMDYAVFNEYISHSPFKAGFKPLVQNESKREAFTEEEIVSIFSHSIDNYVYWLASLTGAVTGMRISEVLGLTGEHVKDGYIEVCQQFYGRRVISSTKSGQKRFVPVPHELEMMLRDKGAETQFIFQVNGYSAPIYANSLNKFLASRFTEKMSEEKRSRLLTFHSLRYFFNTYLRAAGIMDAKINYVIGHADSSVKMMGLYTTWRPEMFSDIREAQERLLGKILAAVPELRDNTLSSLCRSLPSQQIF